MGMSDCFPDGWLLAKGLGGLTGCFTWNKPRSREFPRLVQPSVPFLYSFARRKRISEEIGNWEKNGSRNQSLFLEIIRVQCG